ncbi:MAG: TlpA disulfide reductase family protein [Bdellovibrionota bacterium]
MIRRISMMVVLMCVGVGMVWNASADSKEKASSLVGTNFQGESINVESFYRDRKIVVINFWETWCAPCIQELPDLEALNQKFSSKGVVFVGVYQHSSKEKAQNMIAKAGVTYDILHDEMQSITNHFKIFAYPTTVVLDSSMNVLRKYSGVDADLEAFLIEQLKSIK